MHTAVVGLAILAHVIYICLGGLIFHYLEREHEDKQKNTINLHLDVFLDNYSCVTEHALEDLLVKVEEAINNGVSVSNSSTHANIPRWSYQNAVYFCFTAVTTIGYGNMSPVTSGGQTFLIFYVFLGIPITMIMLGRIGSLGAQWNHKIVKFFACCKFENLKPKTQSQAEFFCMILYGLVIIMALPAIMYKYVEDWSFQESMYFIVVSISTIGFGDLVAGIKGPWYYRVVITLWLFSGLSWFSMIISSFQQNVTSHLQDSIDKKVYSQLSKLSCKKQNAVETEEEAGVTEDTTIVAETNMSTITMNGIKNSKTEAYTNITNSNES